MCCPGRLSIETKSRILGAFEQNTSIQAIDLDDPWDEFTAAERAQFQYYARRNTRLQKLLKKPDEDALPNSLVPSYLAEFRNCPTGMFLIIKAMAGRFPFRSTADIRFGVMEEFLKLRGRNETNFKCWAVILDEGFSLTVPLPNGNESVQGGEVNAGFKRTLSGIADTMGDANDFSSFLQSLGNGQGTVTCEFQCDRKIFLMAGCQAILEWTAATVGAVAKGASSELTMKGSVLGTFDPESNKLLSAKISYDAATVIQLYKLMHSSDEPVLSVPALGLGNSAGCCNIL